MQKLSNNNQKMVTIMQKEKTGKTEKLIYWGAQYTTAARESLVFKRDYDSQDQILINFIGSSGVLPNKGSIMEVTYYFGNDGMYHGVRMIATDPDAFE